MVTRSNLHESSSGDSIAVASLDAGFNFSLMPPGIVSGDGGNRAPNVERRPGKFTFASRFLLLSVSLSRELAIRE